MDTNLNTWAANQKKGYLGPIGRAISLIVFLFIVFLIGGQSILWFCSLFAGTYLLLTAIGWAWTLSKRSQEKAKRANGAPPSYRVMLTTNTAQNLGLNIPNPESSANKNVLYGGLRGFLSFEPDKMVWVGDRRSQKIINTPINLPYMNFNDWKLISLKAATPVSKLGFSNNQNQVIDFTVFDPTDIRVQLSSHMSMPETQG